MSDWCIGTIFSCICDGHAGRRYRVVEEKEDSWSLSEIEGEGGEVPVRSGLHTVSKSGKDRGTQMAHFKVVRPTSLKDVKEQKAVNLTPASRYLEEFGF